MRKRLRYSLPISLMSLIVKNKNSYSKGTQSPELEDRDGKQNKPPIIQEETFSDLLLHLD